MRFLRAGPGRLRGKTDYWCATTIKKRLWLHPPDVPKQVWAVRIDRSGVHWFDAEITKITKRNVMVRYRGEIARLDRQNLWHWWAFYRRVRFVSSRTGRIAAALDEIWWERFAAAGAPPPAMQMPLERARLLLGLPADYSRDDVLAAFRRKAKEAHPDVGGTAEMFRVLVEARDRLLTALRHQRAAAETAGLCTEGRAGGLPGRANRLGSAAARVGDEAADISVINPRAVAFAFPSPSSARCIAGITRPPSLPPRAPSRRARPSCARPWRWLRSSG